MPVLFYAFVSAEPRRAGVPAVNGTIRLGWTLRENLERRADEMLAAPTGATQLRVTRLQDGTSNERWAVRDEPSTVPLEERLGFNRAFHRFLAGCLSFLEQRIATAVERPVSRGARRRVERSRPMAEPAAAVRVIELRRREHDDEITDRGSEGAAWQCQWIVSGHWRRQYYPASNAHKPRYIAPYVKGPADKPLKAPGGNVFAVLR